MIYIIVLIIAGAIGGFISTLKRHNGMLIWPSINIKNRTLRLGFPASLIIGALFAFATEVIIETALPEFVPGDSFYNSFMLGLVAGIASLYSLNEILDKYVGVKISDPDAMTIGALLAPKGEKNIYKQRMYAALDDVSGVERVNIIDGHMAGVIKVVVVPKIDFDNNKIKTIVESVINRYKCPGIQAYVYLPEEIKIDMAFTIEVLDGRNPEETKSQYSTMISKLLTCYINKLQPGESVRQSQIIGEVVKSDDMLRDLITESLTSTPSFVQGRITIGEFQVARAGKIDVTVMVRLPGA